MKIAIIANAKRAVGQLDKNLLDENAQKFNISYDLFIKEPNDLDDFLKQLNYASYTGFLIAGGDGTVRLAVQYLVNQDAPLAILPLGTFNFFARELGFTNNIEELFKIMKNNKVKCIDVGQVNDTIFINHSSIGFYTRILKMRKKHKNVFGTHKLLKTIYTALNFFSVVPIYHLTLQIDDKKIDVRSCLVFIGNNYHFTNLLDFGSRQSLTSGRLSIYILNCKTRWEIFKCMTSIFFNTFEKTQYLTEYVSDNLTIEAESKQVNVVVDGDPLKLDSPLSYTIHKKKLSVFTS